jgi:hypothetical protein
VHRLSDFDFLFGHSLGRSDMRGIDRGSRRAVSAETFRAGLSDPPEFSRPPS